MGLDLQVLGKPLPGHEAEFEALLDQLRDGGPPPARGGGGLGRLLRAFGARPRTEEADDRERFQAITVPGYAQLGAPVVGRDAAADDWVRARFAEGMLDARLRSAEDALAEMEGYHVLALVGDCDGLPAFSSGGLGWTDETSFRGALVADCGEVMTEAQRDAVWELMRAPELAAFGEDLARRVERVRQAHGLEAIPREGIPELHESAYGSLAWQVAVADSLARWSLFWGRKGHGSEPDF